MGSIDADAHVIECERTFEFLEPEFEKYRPLVVATASAAQTVASQVGIAQRDEGFFTAMQKKYGTR